MGVVDPLQEGRKLAAEALGAFTLIFIGAGAIIVTGGANLVAIALAHGLAIALMVSAVGHVSGGLFNPALTIGLWATRRIGTLAGILYIIAQLVGAVVAALALTALFPLGSLTGAALNPARAFGPALVSGTWDDHLVWWIGPIIGAVLAAVVYHYVFADSQKAPVGVP